MVRSMYSGVSGMKAHQTRLDVIGNNISNVNTYGFKSSRATFRDVYYQTMRTASEATGNKGGINPMQVGYGAMIASIDVLQTQSIMSTTGNPLDVAITGDGFFQVQDGDGNIYYTKAGMLDIDDYGNVVDLNGNFVLGVSGNPVGKAPSSDRIQVQVPSVDPANPSVEEILGDVTFTIKASNQSELGNISINFVPDNTMAIGEKVKAVVSSSGIVVHVNPLENFDNAAELENEMNNAIRSANNGEPHPGGDFSITMVPETKFVGGLTGAQICGSNFGVESGKVTLPDSLKRYMDILGVGDGFLGSGATSFQVEREVDTTAPDPIPDNDLYTFTITTATGTYTAELTRSQMKSSGKVVLKGAGGDTDTITIKYPSATTIDNNFLLNNDTPPTPAVGDAASQDYIFTVDSVASTPSRQLGLGGKAFVLTGGTEGGPQTVKDLTGIAIGADGVIVGSHPILGRVEIGRIDLATFENNQGLEQAGNTYFIASKNSGDPVIVQAGTKGTGALKGSALEMSNVDLSQEFSDMITTQRGFQANSRMITVSDTLLEELINLKR